MSWLEQMSRLVLFGCIITLPIEAGGYCNQTIQYYDADRMACLDRCGSDNELRCRVDEVCSSTVPSGAGVQPPACMNQCPKLCKKGRYCEHDQIKCRPCSSLCSAYDKSACRVFCYDFFKAPPVRFADPRDCETNQYFDNDRRVCLDQCGADNETKCQVDQFCSSRITWSMHYDPPACVSHCNELCYGDTYCDHISHGCLACDTLCLGPDRQACQIHCNEIFAMTTAALSPIVYHSTTSSHSNSTERRSILMIVSIILAVIIILSVSGNLYQGKKKLWNAKKGGSQNLADIDVAEPMNQTPVISDDATTTLFEQPSSRNLADIDFAVPKNQTPVISDGITATLFEQPSSRNLADIDAADPWNPFELVCSSSYADSGVTYS